MNAAAQPAIRTTGLRKWYGRRRGLDGLDGLDLEAIGGDRFAAATIGLVLLGACFGSLPLAVGAVTGRRMLAGAAVAVVAVVTYFGNTLGPSIEWLAWLQTLSPFAYYSGGEPLRNGLQIAESGVLLLASAVMVALGGVGFARRDIAV